MPKGVTLSHKKILLLKRVILDHTTLLDMICPTLPLIGYILLIN